MLYYEAGDVILLKHVKFVDNNKMDVKSNKRPFILLNDYELFDDEAFLLKLSTDERLFKKDPNRYYPLLPNNRNKLKRKSYVDLHFRYSTREKSEKVVGRIDAVTLEKIKNSLRFKNI